jgi:hypothetical protein
MKISAIFLAAMFVLALSGQAVEARDHHHGWRSGHHGHHNHWNNSGWNNNRGWKYQRSWNNNRWNNNGWNNRSAFNNGYGWSGGKKMTRAKYLHMQKQIARGKGYRYY